MSKKIILYMTLMVLMIIPHEVKAVCSNSEISRLSSLATNVSIAYDYVESNGQVSFNIVLTNLHPELYVKDVANQVIHYYNNSSEMVLTGFKANRNYRFDIYAGTCNSRLYSLYVTLPGYNPYYNDPICEGVTHNICQKWINMKYDYDTFIQEVNKIKTITEKTDEIVVEEEYLGIYDYILLFYTKYYFIILPAIIIVCVIVIVRERKKDSLF